MAGKRASDFDLRAAIRSVSFTPGRRDLSALLDLLDEREHATAARGAILRLGPEAAVFVRAELARAQPPRRSRLVRLLGLLARDDTSLRQTLCDLLEDADAKTRRQAAISLGKLGRGPDVEIERALLEAWRRAAAHPEMRRVVVEALAHVGGELTHQLLAELPEDSELAALALRTKRMVERNLGASERWAIDVARLPTTSLAIRLHCRSGLEAVLVEEMGSRYGRVSKRRGCVEAVLQGPLRDIASLRTMLGFGFPLTTECSGGESTMAALGRLIGSPAALRIFREFTQGPVRYRLGWAGGEKRRGERMRLLEELAERNPWLINDPSRRGWDVSARAGEGKVEIELRPRIEDARFAYRLATLPASSHPTVAAALARVGGVEAGDVVWDPFMGAGSELIERALLGPYAALHGSDIDQRALAAARMNLDAAGIANAVLLSADALQAKIRGLTLVVTNPPLGRRLLATADVLALQRRFLHHAGVLLRPRGRMAWTTPFAEALTDDARQAGLRLEWQTSLDMGGFHVALQKLRKLP